jgi:hypothetical protein
VLQIDELGGVVLSSHTHREKRVCVFFFCSLSLSTTSFQMNDFFWLVVLSVEFKREREREQNRELEFVRLNALHFQLSEPVD